MELRYHKARCPRCGNVHVAPFPPNADPVADDIRPDLVVACCPGCATELVLYLHNQQVEDWGPLQRVEPSDN
jgi:ribosomal protein S27E